MEQQGEQDYYHEDDVDGIGALLVGRTVTKMTDDELRLDDGRRLKLIGHEGGCSCGAGDYALTQLSGVDNVITRVELDNDPAGDDAPAGATGVYRIFVYANNERLNLATFEGTDGNGFYGTGYSIRVYPATSE